MQMWRGPFPVQKKTYQEYLKKVVRTTQCGEKKRKKRKLKQRRYRLLWCIAIRVAEKCGFLKKTKKEVCLCFAALRPITLRKDWRHISKVLLLKKSSQRKSSVDFVPLDANKLGPRYFCSISFFPPSMKAFLECLRTRVCAAALSCAVAFQMSGRVCADRELCSLTSECWFEKVKA